jgi:hypothetical protein
MSDKSNSHHAAEEWKRLWRVGANGENINSRKQKNKRKRDNEKNKSNTNNTRNQTTNMNQLDLSGYNLDQNDVEEFGDKMAKKTEHTLRIMLQNINRLPTDHRATKSRKLLSTLVNKQIDIALLTEVGLYWNKIPNHDKWYERV